MTVRTGTVGVARVVYQGAISHRWRGPHVFLVHPLGVDEVELDRIPWVSLSIAVACALMFALTWVIPPNPFGGSDAQLEEMIEFWQENPNVKPPEVLLERLNPAGRERVEALHTQALAEQGEPSAVHQEHLDGLAADFERTSESSLLRKLSLVPSRGAAQWGWLMGMFLHFGWMHLLGNLFFLYLVGPMLEDVWSRPLFAVFYLVGGVVAGLAQAAWDWGSNVLIAGASGAIAAAMGAFAYRFATKHIRMGYFIWLITIYRGTFRMPAWLAGAAWLVLELWSLVTGGDSGVAVMAHIGGFVFGLGTAVSLRRSGLEERYLTPAVTRKTGNYVRHSGLDVAAEALARGDTERARSALSEVLAAYPDNVEASLMLYQLEVREGRPEAGARLERTCLRLVSQARLEAATDALQHLGEDFNPSHLRPMTAFRLASLLEADTAFPRVRLAALYTVSLGAAGAIGARARLRLAEFAWEERKHEVAREHLTALGRMENLPEETSRRAAELRAKMEAQDAWRNVEPEEEAPIVARSSHPPRILLGGKVVGESATGLMLQAAHGEQRELAWSGIVGMAAGLLPSTAPGQTSPRLLPVTDLVLRWGDEKQGSLVLRLDFAHLGLATLYPGVPPKEGYARLLRTILQFSEATVLPDAAALQRAEYPRYADADAMTRALYGSRP